MSTPAQRARAFALGFVPVLLCACSGDATSASEGGDGAGPNALADGGGGSSGNGASSSGTPSSNGATDAGSGTTGPSSCTAADVCVDFEATAAPSPVAPNCAGTGALAIDASVAHGGSKSLRVDGKGGYCNHAFFSAGDDALGRFGDVVHLRFYVRLSTTLADAHVTFLASKAQSSGKDIRMGGQNGIFMYNRETDDATLPELSPAGVAASVKPTPNAWHCVESVIDRKASVITTTIDGAAVNGLATTGAYASQWTSKTGGLDVTDLRLGWEAYGSGDMTVWFDDVAVGTHAFGCAK